MDRKPPATKRSGIVQPHELKAHQRLGAWLAYAGLRVLGGTQRIRFQADPAAREWPADRPVIFALWHNRLAYAITFQRVIWRRLNRTTRLAALISASRDGAWLAAVLRHAGMVPVRGSSSRRGSQALRELTTLLKQGCDVAITPDGPRGPRYVVQEGIVSLAQLSGAPIVPIVNEANRKLALRSWDAFRVPVPLARAQLTVGTPVFVPREVTLEERKSFCRLLETRLGAG